MDTNESAKSTKGVNLLLGKLSLKLSILPQRYHADDVLCTNTYATAENTDMLHR
jgi:hypothetical protein